jgi:hypothetical protein
MCPGGQIPGRARLADSPSTSISSLARVLEAEEPRAQSAVFLAAAQPLGIMTFFLERRKRNVLETLP